MPPLILKVLAAVLPTHAADTPLETDHSGLKMLLASIQAEQQQQQQPETRTQIGDKLAIYGRVTGPYRKLYLDVYQKAYNRHYDRMDLPKRGNIPLDPGRGDGKPPRIDPGRGDGKMPRIDPGRGDGKFRRN
jgi:hypothetical protein